MQWLWTYNNGRLNMGIGDRPVLLQLLDQSPEGEEIATVTADL